jgi:uncharacterized membrane protein AbrB (regulator of aidB expression)
MGDNGDNNYYYNNYNYNQAHNELDHHVNTATIALVTGLLSIPFCFFFNSGIILGGIAIVMAILSKGTAKKLLPQAKKGIIYGTIGIVIGYSVAISSMYTVITNPEVRQEMNTMTEQLYGESFDDMLKDLGIPLDD